jgi:hypothetical protein
VGDAAVCGCPAAADPDLGLFVFSGDLGLDAGKAQSVFRLDTAPRKRVKTPNRAACRVSLSGGARGECLWLQPHSPGLAERVWYGAASLSSVRWAGSAGVNLLLGNVSSAEQTTDFATSQVRQTAAFREALPAGRTPRSISYTSSRLASSSG